VSDGTHPNARLGAVAAPYVAVAALVTVLHLTAGAAAGERGSAPLAAAAAHVLPVVLLFWRARWASLPLALLALPYAAGVIAGPTVGP